MKSIFAGLTFVTIIVGVGGCASFSNYLANYPYIEDLERELEAKNYKPNFARSNEQMVDSASFNRETLIGQWECQVDVQSHTLCNDDIMSRMADVSQIEKHSFAFNADGTYTQTLSGQKSLPISCTGHWKYEHGGLVLSQMRCVRGDRSIADEAELRYRVVWFSDGRVLITQVDGERLFAPKKSKSRIILSTDKHGVQREKLVWVATVDNGRERGFITVSFRSPTVYSRVAGNAGSRANANGKVLSDSADYRITEFERLKDKDFSYAFTLELAGGAKASNLREIGKKFGDEAKQNYIETFHTANPDKLQVLLDWHLENGLLKGVVSVVNVIPVSLIYDANARAGRVTVRAEVNQLSEARTWIGKNIKRIVCEKNVVLESGARPTDDAHYSVTRETVKDGGLIEVEFKAE